MQGVARNDRPPRVRAHAAVIDVGDPVTRVGSLLWWYRRLVPGPLRRSTLRWVPAGSRLRLARLLSRRGPFRTLSDAVRMWLFIAWHRALLADPGRVVVRSSRRLRIAEAREDLAPLQARRENLDAVCEALSAAGVPFFCVRGHSDLRGVVAVAERDRTRALTALEASCRGQAVYVGAVRRRFVPELATPRAWRALASAPVIRLVRLFTTPEAALVLGPGFGCEVEFWADGDGELAAPRHNRVASRVREDAPRVEAPGEVFTRLASPVGASGPSTYPTYGEFASPLVDDITFPIDVVYTWVDGSDPAWLARKDATLAAMGMEGLNEQSANASRYLDREELRYSLRSISAFAPWVRHIYLVTDDQVPSWLDTTHSRLTVVSHRELFGDRGRLPTFNSHAIESQLHRIPGLAEHYLYFNDDTFLGRPVPPHLFFHANGVAKFFPSRVQVELGPATRADPPVLAAGKNNRRLVADAFGRMLTQKMKHIPHPQQRSVLYELERLYPEEFAETARHQFRHPGDIAVPSALKHYYAYLTGRAVPGRVRYAYSDLADPATPMRLVRLLARRDYDTFCLNDTDADEADLQRQSELVRWFLRSYYPVPSPFELAVPHLPSDTLDDPRPDLAVG